MKVFDRDGKYNFVDENNVFVGFDAYQDCCEDFGYAFTREIPKRPEQEEKWIDDVPQSDKDLDKDDFPGYNFDRDFFKELDFNLDGGGAVAFKLNGPEGPIYLTLYNSHNGYYSHGFTMTHNGITLQSDYL